MAKITRLEQNEAAVSDDTLSEYHNRESNPWFDFKTKFDMPFFILTLIILVIGVVTVLSASFARAYSEGRGPAYYFKRQLFYALIGVGAMLLASGVKPNGYRRWSVLALFASILALIAVLVIGSRSGGAKRWIYLGFTTFQPSEIAKIGVILAYSHWMCKYKNKMKSLKRLLYPFAFYLLIIVFLLYKEPHLSCTIIICAVAAVLLFLGGVDLKWFALGAVLLGIGAFWYVKTMGYASARIMAWRDPFEYASNEGYQIVQSLYAVGSGGLLGLGMGQGRQKYLYLPEEHNDFIFSVFCEEMGYIGAVLVVLLFGLLIWRGFWIARNTRSRYGFFVAAGISTLLAIQVFLNIAVVTNTIPCTGISLPFFSYGGTALAVQLGEMGIVLAVSKEIPLKTRK